MRERLSIFLAVLVAVFLACYTHAEAYVIENFSAAAIDTGKWVVTDPVGQLSQHDGRLHFHSAKNSGSRILSKESFGPGFFSLQFYNFDSTNTSPGGMHEGFYVSLGLGSVNNYVRMLRGRVGNGGYFEANYFADGKLSIWYVRANAADGQLGLCFDGSNVSFYYNAGMGGKKSVPP